MKKALSRKNLWDGMPPALKKTIGLAFKYLPPGYCFGKKFRNTLNWLGTTKHWPQEKVREYQLAKLKEVCSIAYTQTPFYRKLFESVGFHPGDLKSPEDMRLLPLIDRRMVVENLNEMCAQSIDSPTIDYVETAGTSGTRLGFYMHSGRSAVEYAYLVAGWERVGFHLGIPKAVLRKKSPKPDNSGLRHEYDPLLNEHYYSTFHLSDEDIGKYLDHIATIGKCFLHVYPSAIAVVARYIERTGKKVPSNICGILAESEIVYPDQKELVESCFSVRYYSSYGHSEKLIAATECEHSTDYHLWPTYGFAELIDENNNLITEPGKRGELVGTGFLNTVMPFIRYRTGDEATLVGYRCPDCGREHMIIKDIRGHKLQEMLVANDGSLIPWVSVNSHDETFVRVRQMQFYQDTPGYATLRIVVSSDFSETDLSRIDKILALRFGSRIKISVVTCEKISITERGKAIHVDQRIKGIQI
jgi:phenylacetate-CoA ligase